MIIFLISITGHPFTGSYMLFKIRGSNFWTNSIASSSRCKVLLLLSQNCLIWRVVLESDRVFISNNPIFIAWLDFRKCLHVPCPVLLSTGNKIGQRIRVTIETHSKVSWKFCPNKIFQFNFFWKRDTISWFLWGYFGLTKLFWSPTWYVRTNDL